SGRSSGSVTMFLGRLAVQPASTMAGAAPKRRFRACPSKIVAPIVTAQRLPRKDFVDGPPPGRTYTIVLVSNQHRHLDDSRAGQVGNRQGDVAADQVAIENHRRIAEDDLAVILWIGAEDRLGDLARQRRQQSP